MIDTLGKLFNLSGLLRWIRNVIEEADQPLSLLLTVLLPFIAPIIPSMVTRSNLIKYMNYTDTQATIASVAFALVGYVAMIATIGSIMVYVDEEESTRNWLPILISGGSYLTYVLALILVNILLEYTNHVEGVKISVTAVMTLGLEIPSALLNGTRIGERKVTEKKLRDTSGTRNFELEKRRIEAEMEANRLKAEGESRERIALAEAAAREREKIIEANAKIEMRKLKVSAHQSQAPQPQPQQFQSQVKSVKTKRDTVNPIKDEIFALMDKTYARHKRVLTHSELVTAGYDKSTAWRHRNAWLENRPEAK